MPKQSFIRICWCSLCECLYVECPECGNNTCNGTYGKDGTCQTCPKVYDIMKEIRLADINKSILEIIYKPTINHETMIDDLLKEAEKQKVNGTINS